MLYLFLLFAFRRSANRLICLCLRMCICVFFLCFLTESLRDKRIFLRNKLSLINSLNFVNLRSQSVSTTYFIQSSTHYILCTRGRTRKINYSLWIFSFVTKRRRWVVCTKVWETLAVGARTHTASLCLWSVSIQTTGQPLKEVIRVENKLNTNLMRKKWNRHCQATARRIKKKNKMNNWMNFLYFFRREREFFILPKRFLHFALRVKNENKSANTN